MRRLMVLLVALVVVALPNMAGKKSHWDDADLPAASREVTRRRR